MSRICHPEGAVFKSLLAAALIVAVAAGVAGCGGSDSTGTGSGGAAEATEAAETTQQPKSGPTEAALEPVEEGTAAGRARYLLEPNREPVLQIRVHGLEPVSGQQRYAIWIVGDRHDMVNLAAFHVGEDGRISRDIASPEAYAFVEEGSKTELLVTKVESIEAVGDGISESSNPWDPPIIGEPIVAGTFVGPFVGSSGNG